MFFYLYANLIISSEVALSPLVPAQKNCPVDVRISFARIPDFLVPPLHSKPHFQVYSDGKCILHTPSGVRFLLDNGCQITVDIQKSEHMSEAYSWLLGPALALLMHQRNLPPLHASAVAINGVAIAVAGNSGQGKSTTARALTCAGHGLLSDDQVLVAPEDLLVSPNRRSVLLWPETANSFNDTISDAQRALSNQEKFAIEPDVPLLPPACPLAAILVLSEEPAAFARVEQVRSQLAAALIYRHVLRLRLAIFMGKGPQIFAWATGIAARVPVYQLHRPRDFSKLNQLVSCIEDVAKSRREILR